MADLQLAGRGRGRRPPLVTARALVAGSGGSSVRASGRWWAAVTAMDLAAAAWAMTSDGYYPDRLGRRDLARRWLPALPPAATARHQGQSVPPPLLRNAASVDLLGTISHHHADTVLRSWAQR